MARGANKQKVKQIVPNKSGIDKQVGWGEADERMPCILTDRVGREAQVSSFGLLKVAPESIIESFRYSVGNINSAFDIVITASGAWSIVNTTSLKLNSGASANSKVTLTSKKTHEYKPGIGILYKASIMLGDSGVAGNKRSWGLRNGNNGVWIRLNGTAYELVIMSNGVETIIPASSWNIPVTPDNKGHLWYIQYQWLGVGNFYLYYDEKLVYIHKYLGTSNVTSMEVPDLKAYFNNENTTNTTNVEFKSGCSVISMEGGNTISGIDDNGIIREVAVSATRRLLVSQEPPTPPASTTPVKIFAQSDMSGTEDSDYVIPNGETIIIQRLVGGGEGDGSTSKVELFYDPNGNGVGMTLISLGYVADNNFQFDLSDSFTGDGTAKIKMRRTRISAGTREVFGSWTGYY